MLRVTCPPTRLAERRYILDTVLAGWLGHDYVVKHDTSVNEVVIELAGADGRLTVADHVLALDDFDRLGELESGDDGRDADIELGVVAGVPTAVAAPVVWGPIPATATRVHAGGAALHLDLDVFGTAFALITGLSEHAVSERDVHERIPMAATVLGRRDLVSRPVVDEQVSVLEAALSHLWPRLERAPSMSRSVPTHDVDRLYRYGTTAAATSVAVLGRVRSGDPRAVWAAAQGAFDVRVRGRQDPYFSFEEIMDISERFGVTSNFYFIPRYQASDGTLPSRYSMRSPVVTALLGRIDERGHTVGIHPGYESFRNTRALRLDVAELRAAAAQAGVVLDEVGGRHHYLRWDPVRSPLCWHEAGLAHDSSFGFSERPGFRAGTSRPYRLWDHVNRRETSVEERPLIWMDASVFAADPAGLESDSALGEAMALRRHCFRHGGDFTFLVHNDGFRNPGGPAAYRALLGG